MSDHKLSPPCNKSLSDSNIQLYDVGCKDFVLDTRKSLSNAGFVKSNNAQKDLRRRQLPCASESAKNVRIRTNKILQTQNRVRKGIVKEFVKSDGITVKGLQAIHAINSEECFWNQNAIQSHSPVPVVDPSHLNIYGGYHSKVNLHPTPNDLPSKSHSGQDKKPSGIVLGVLPTTNRKPPSPLAESLLLGKRRYQRIPPFEPDVQNILDFRSTDKSTPRRGEGNPQKVESEKSPRCLVNPRLAHGVTKPKELKITTKSNQLRIDDLIFRTYPIAVMESEYKNKRTSDKSRFRQANHNTDSKETSEYTDDMFIPLLTPEFGEKNNADLKQKPQKESGASYKDIHGSNRVTEQLHELTNNYYDEQKEKIRKLHKEQAEKEEIVVVDVSRHPKSISPPLLRSLSRTQRSLSPSLFDNQSLVHENGSLTKIISTPRFEPIPPPGGLRRVELVEDFHFPSPTNERSNVKVTRRALLHKGSTIDSKTSLRSDTDSERTDISASTSKTNLLENPREKPKHASTLNRAAALRRRAKEAEQKALERALRLAAEEEAERLRLEAIRAALAARYAGFADYDIPKARPVRKRNSNEDIEVEVVVEERPASPPKLPEIQPPEVPEPEVVPILHKTKPVIELEVEPLPEPPICKRKIQIQIYSEIPSKPVQYETIKFRSNWKYESPPLEKLLEDPTLRNFTSPPRLSIVTPPTIKGKKKRGPKPPPPPAAEKTALHPPLQPPTGLCTYDEELKGVPTVEKVKFVYERTHNMELNRAITEFREFDSTSTERMLARPWLQGRLAFSKQICRFELPSNLVTLQGMSPVEYIADYSVISPRRINLYTAVFNHQLGLRKSNKSFTRALHRSTLQPNKCNTTLGGVKTMEGMHADMMDVIRGGSGRDERSASGRTLKSEDALTLKETAAGLAQIHVGGVKDLQVAQMFRLLRLVDKENPSILESKVKVDCTLFCAMCALLERMFYLHFLVEDAHQHATDDSGTRLMLEMADFFGFNAKIKNLRLQPGLRALFSILTK